MKKYMKFMLIISVIFCINFFSSNKVYADRTFDTSGDMPSSPSTPSTPSNPTKIDMKLSTTYCWMNVGETKEIIITTTPKTSITVKMDGNDNEFTCSKSVTDGNRNEYTQNKD